VNLKRVILLGSLSANKSEGQEEVLLRFFHRSNKAITEMDIMISGFSFLKFMGGKMFDKNTTEG
jgi:hypothetical protein